MSLPLRDLDAAEVVKAKDLSGRKALKECADALHASTGSARKAVAESVLTTGGNKEEMTAPLHEPGRG